MNGLFIFLLLSAGLSIIGFSIRAHKTKNIFLVGKIISRLFLVWAVLLHLYENIHLADVLVAFVVINLADFIYDGFNFILSKAKRKLFEEKFLNPFNLTDGIKFPVIIVNKETGLIESINKEFENVVKLKKEDIIGKSVEQIFNGLSIENFCNVFTYGEYTARCFEVQNGKSYIIAYFY